MERYLSVFSPNAGKCGKTLRKKSPYSELFWSAFFQHFPAFGLNMERYLSVFSLNAGKCGKTLRKKSPYSELFWSAFFQHFPALGLNTESPYLVRMWENAGKMQTRISPNFDSFCAVLDVLRFSLIIYLYQSCLCSSWNLSIFSIKTRKMYHYLKFDNANLSRKHYGLESQVFVVIMLVLLTLSMLLIYMLKFSIPTYTL